MMVSGPASVFEGALYTLTLGEIVDPGNDPINGIEVDWGDGTIEMYPEPAVLSHTFADGPSSPTIRVSIIDQFSTKLPIADLTVVVTNATPEILSLTGPGTSSEGDSVAFAAAASDAGSDTLTYTWDFGDGTLQLPGVDLTTPTHNFADNGVYAVTLTVSDEDGASTTQTTIVSVSNVAPSGTLVGASETDEGSVYDLDLSGISDPGVDNVSEVIIDWGDGNTVSYPDWSVLQHTYAEGPANHRINVTLVDEDGAHELAATVDVSVSNLPPNVVDITGDLIGPEGEPLAFAANVFDPAGPYDAITYTWDFGDGSEPISGINLSNVSHLFADDGLYTGTLTVTDEDGDQSTQTSISTLPISGRMSPLRASRRWPRVPPTRSRSDRSPIRERTRLPVSLSIGETGRRMPTRSVRFRITFTVMARPTCLSHQPD